MYISVFVEGLRKWRGTFWLLNESLSFKGPATLQATAFYRIGVYKISPKFETLFSSSL
jgi:hypothetical protein